MKKPVKVVLALAIAATAGFLFIRSVKQSTAEPYTVLAPHLNGWTVAFGEGAEPTTPLLMLHGPSAFADGLSHQIFKRAMESLSTPPSTVMPLLLRGEFERSFAGRVTPEQLLALAHKVGLGAGPVAPLCLGYRRTSQAGSSPRQLYFVMFELPAFAQFRRELAALSGNVSFDPAALSPAVAVGTSQASVDSWMPLSADPARDCLAPVVVSSTAP